MADPLTIYVLDDDPAIGDVLCRMLRTLDHGALAFEDPDRFLSAIEHAHPRLVIVDLALGRTDAVDVIRRLEALNYQGDVMLMSGRATALLAEISEVGKTRGLSMLPPLSKPFRLADVSANLASPAQKIAKPVLPVRTPPSVDLKEALERGWVELWYQPKVDLRTASVCGAEALLRVQHPELGLLTPAQVLPSAGDPLYGALSTAVVEIAMSDWAIMARQDIRLKLAINVPASVLAHPSFVGVLRDNLPSDAVFPGLVVEVTEDEIVKDPKAIREVALQLGLSSIELSIDDFGTANASLARLQELPCSELKLDRSFVSGCSSDVKKRSICISVCELAGELKIATCAEGIDNEEDLRTISAIGFDRAQGYLIAPPMPLDGFIGAMLNERLSPLNSSGALCRPVPSRATHIADARMSRLFSELAAGQRIRDGAQML
jgi:EAL domain-containing protein (putative c-di-GMP-specific phosphodiesterase class I)/ActR/RegA family two-component response regulator